MAKFTPSSLTSTYSAVAALNANFDDIAALFEQCVFRDGTAPNSMNSALDLNHFKIQNLADGEANTDAVNLGQLTSMIATSTGTVLPNSSIPAASRAAMAALVSTSFPAVLTEAGREGIFVFDASNLSAKVTADPQQGIYVAPSSDTTGASGAWVRKFTGRVCSSWFGHVDGSNGGANASANNAALSGMFATLLARSPAIFASPVLEPVWINASYLEISQTITPGGGCDIIGNGSGHISGSLATGTAYAGTVIQAIGCTALAVNYTRSSVSNLFLQGDFSGTEAEHHGLSATQLCYLTNVKAWKFAGDGFNFDGKTGSGHLADSCRLLGCEAFYCRDGLSVGITGGNGDANVIQIIGGMFNYNRRWGVNDYSFLGNAYFSVETANNGVTLSNDGTSLGASVVVYSGYTYFAIAGQEAGASTNAPTGAATSNTWWAYKGGTGTDAPSIGRPAWTSGMLVRAGGSYHTDVVTGHHVFSGCYAESDQGFAQLSYPAIVQGGVLATYVYSGSTATVLDNDGSGALKSKTGFSTTNGTATARLGTNRTAPAAGGILAEWSEPTIASAGYQWKFDTGSQNDLLLTYGNSSSPTQMPILISTPGSADQFGTGAAFPHAFYPAFPMIGGNSVSRSNARRMMIDTTAPSTGAHGQGEYCFYRGTTTGQLGWQCTTAGTPGTWTSLYAMTAAKGAAYAAWTGTANRATKDTSTATLVDVAQTLKALIDDLQARGVLA